MGAFGVDHPAEGGESAVLDASCITWMQNASSANRPLRRRPQSSTCRSRRQLEALGLRRGAITRRVEIGRLHGVHQGVYALGHSILSIRGHWLAAVLACGDGAMLSRAWSLLGRAFA